MCWVKPTLNMFCLVSENVSHWYGCFLQCSSGFRTSITRVPFFCANTIIVYRNYSTVSRSWFYCLWIFFCLFRVSKLWLLTSSLQWRPFHTTYSQLCKNDYMTLACFFFQNGVFRDANLRTFFTQLFLTNMIATRWYLQKVPTTLSGGDDPVDFRLKFL